MCQIKILAILKTQENTFLLQKANFSVFFKESRHVRQRGQQSNPPINQVSGVSHKAIFKMKDGNEKKKGKV